MGKHEREIIEGLQEQVAGMHDLINRLKAGAALNRETARIELAIEPTYLSDGQMYYIAPERRRDGEKEKK